MTEAKDLTRDEIASFVGQFQQDSSGYIALVELERRLDNVAWELQVTQHPHHLHSEDKLDQRHAFLRTVLGTEETKISASHLSSVVARWKVPSMEQDQHKSKDEIEYLSKVASGRRLRALWEVHGPEYLFLVLVFCLQVAFGVWQCVKYATGAKYQAALGWGVGLSRACAGALWPTMFFVVLSMSRWYSTSMRRFYYLSRFVNWDRSQSFHVKISTVGLALATLHSIGHLSGSFVLGSRGNRQDAVEDLLGAETVLKRYINYIQSRPGWTGLAALGLYWAIALTGVPWVRKRSYEFFQLGHLLMFPLIAMLMAHGTAELLQFPVMGIILAVPTLLVLSERGVRVFCGVCTVPAEFHVLDEKTVRVTCDIPLQRSWRYQPGQYCFLQVPRVSFFQWHPFTISRCSNRKVQFHIKTEYNWTSRLRSFNGIHKVGIDGPFGAPAQRFHDYQQTMIIGAGIGVTPFAGVLHDLQERTDCLQEVKRSRRVAEKSLETSQTETPVSRDIDQGLYRRAEFHWIVRDTNHLLWFSDLLNRLALGDHSSNLDVRIHNHLTEKHKDITLHIFRWLLEKHRYAITGCQEPSLLTGLIAPTHFGRPHFPEIMNKHYAEMLELFARDKNRRRRVGVFFCGSPGIGATLADLCHQLTLRGREDRSFVEYHFSTEVF